MTGQPYGHYAVTAFTNGIPSAAAIVALAKAYGQPLVPDYPDCTVSLHTGGEVPRIADAETRAAQNLLN